MTDVMKIKRLLKRAFLQIDYSGNIDHKIESLLVKLANEITFDEAIKGKKFVNPETKNKVNFTSLPGEEQKKIRQQFQNKVEDSSEEKGGKDIAKKMRDSITKDKKLRDQVVKNIKSPETKKKIVDGIKAHVKEDDLNKLGDSLKKKDPKSFKESLPRIMKGLAKGLLIGLGVILVVGLSRGDIANAVKETTNDLKKDAIDDLDNDHAAHKEELIGDHLEKEVSNSKDKDIKESFENMSQKDKVEILVSPPEDNKISEMVNKAQEKAYADMTESQIKAQESIEKEYLEKRNDFMEIDTDMEEELNTIIKEEYDRIEKEMAEAPVDSKESAKKMEEINKAKEKLMSQEKEWESDKKYHEETLNKLTNNVKSYEDITKKISEVQEEIKKELKSIDDPYISKKERDIQNYQKLLSEDSSRLTDAQREKIEKEITGIEKELNDYKDEFNLESKSEKTKRQMLYSSKLKELEEKRDGIAKSIILDSHSYESKDMSQKEKTEFLSKYRKMTQKQKTEYLSESVAVAKENIRSIKEDISILDSDIEISQKKQKEYSEKQENLKKQKSEIENFEASLKDIKKLDELTKRATVSKFSKANEINLNSLAEKLQEKLSEQVSKKTNKKAYGILK